VQLEEFGEWVKIVHLVGFEVFTAFGMRNAFFWYVTPCGSCMNRRFGRTYLHHQGDKNGRAWINISSN
jgi:hypothetical protein